MIYGFAHFELDVAKAELRVGDRPVPLEPQVFALLAFLLEHRERLVSRDEIFENVWDGRIVSDAALASRVKSARKALGDDGHAQRFIKTVHGKGFRFVADVQVRRATAGAGVWTATDVAAIAPPLNVASGGQPSIAVLPFRVIGDPGPWATIADGLPHELINELARLRWLFVIARGSSFRIREVEPDYRDVGRRLGVRYCLAGTVEVSERRLLITTELVDTRDASVVWGERYSGAIDDIHSLRGEIRLNLLASLEIRIPLHEAADARLCVTENLDAWSAYHLGLQHIYRFNRRDNAAAAALFNHAVRQDPGFARAHAGLSFVHFQTAFLRQTNDIAGEIASARRSARHGLDLDPLDPFVNFTMGRSFWLEGDLERALSWLERATALSPNYSQGIYARAWTETLSGNAVDARQHVDLAMRLSPLDPLHYAMLATRGFAHLLTGEVTEAVIWTERAARAPGAHVLIAMIAAVTQSLAGNEASAKGWAANVRERNPGLTRADFFSSFPVRPPEIRVRVAAALEDLGF
jgi:TolB-like protein/Tfp pilus assembly protein PilF